MEIMTREVLKNDKFVFFLLGDSPASEFCSDVSEHSASSIFIGGVCSLHHL